MALSGYKDFVNGTPLLEGDLDNYFMSQIPMHFATTAARDTAITVPVEGMLAMIDGTYDILYRYNGASWDVWLARGAGTPEGNVTAGIGALYQRSDGGTDTTLYIKQSGAGNTGWVAVGASIPANDTASVATNETTTSTTMTDLATAGPAVTVTTGTKALVMVSAYIYNNTAGSLSRMGYAVSGASTVAASDNIALQYTPGGVNYAEMVTFAHLVTGLTAGSNTFTAKYDVGANTGGFINRRIAVVNMGS